MAWTPLKKKEDPFERRRRELEEQARNLSQRQARIESQLKPKTSEPQKPKHPVIRPDPEEDFYDERRSLSESPRRRVLSAQRRRDRNLFIVLAAVLGLIVIWLLRSWMT